MPTSNKWFLAFVDRFLDREIYIFIERSRFCEDSSFNIPLEKKVLFLYLALTRFFYFFIFITFISFCISSVDYTQVYIFWLLHCSCKHLEKLSVTRLTAFPLIAFGCLTGMTWIPLHRDIHSLGMLLLCFSHSFGKCVCHQKYKAPPAAQSIDAVMVLFSTVEHSSWHICWRSVFMHLFILFASFSH